MSTDRKPTKEEAERARKVLDKCLVLKENKLCADCDERGPRWASVSLGAFVCLQCSGIHRKLGVHISKVKSVTLDSWTVEQAKNMQRWGNKKVNAVFQATMPSGVKRPTPESNTALKENFIRAKYERREFYGEPSPTSPVDNEERQTISTPQERPAFKKTAEVRRSAPPQIKAQITEKTVAVDLMSFGGDTPTNVTRVSSSLTEELFGGNSPASSLPQTNGSSFTSTQETNKPATGNSPADLFQAPERPREQTKKGTLTSENLMALYSQGSQVTGSHPIPFQTGPMGGQRPIGGMNSSFSGQPQQMFTGGFGPSQPMMGGMSQPQPVGGGGFGQSQPMMGGMGQPQPMIGGGFGQSQPMMGSSGFGAPSQQPMMGGGFGGQPQPMLGGGFGAPSQPMLSFEQSQPMMGGGFGGNAPSMMGGGMGFQQSRPMMASPSTMGGGGAMSSAPKGQRPISKPKSDPNDPFAGLTGL